MTSRQNGSSIIDNIEHSQRGWSHRARVRATRWLHPGYAATARARGANKRRCRRDLLDRADQVLDFLGMGPKLPGELVEIGIGDGDEARFVDIGDDLDADRPEFFLRLMLELDRFRRLVPVDLVGG